MSRSWFQGAVLPVRGVEVLIVVVQPWVLTDLHEANLFMFAFQTRFQRPVVLVAQDEHGAPHFYGPTELARTLRALPLPVIPWRRFLYRPEPRPTWQLPIPADSDGGDDNGDDTADGAAGTPALRNPRSESALRHTRGLDEALDAALDEADAPNDFTTRR